MRIVKVGVLAPTNKGIPLGVQGESCATEVEFDTRPWFREYPSGTVSAVARREGDPAPYPLALDVADGTAVWTVSDTDTAKAGVGAVELTMTSGGTRVRSLTFKTAVTASLTDAPVDDDAWYGWLDKAVVKVDETVQSAQRKMAEVDAEWTDLKADVTAKVEECGEVAAQAARDAHHAKVDAQATAKALESAEGSVAKAEEAAKRAVDAALDTDDSAVEASKSAQSAGRSAEAAAKSASDASTSEANAATYAGNASTSATGAATSAEHAAAQKVAAENAKDAAETFKAGAEAAKGEAAKSAVAASESATAAAKSASDAAASVNAINVIAPKSVDTAAVHYGVDSVAIGNGSTCEPAGAYSIVIGSQAHAHKIGTVAIGPGARDVKNTIGQNVIIGDNANAGEGVSGSVAIGAYSMTEKKNEFSVGHPIDESGYEGTREITHVSTPTASSSAATKAYVDMINVIANPRVLNGAVAVPSSIAIGNGVSANFVNSVVIGGYSKYSYSVAIGIGASNGGNSSVAIGYQSRSTDINQFAVGSDERLREIVGVKTPTSDTSAATKGYVDKLVTSANMVRGSSSITVADGVAKVNPAIFGDGLAVTDGQVSADMDYIAEHLAGDALYYDQTDGLTLKVGQGLRIQNDELDLDQAGLPLASAGVRGTVRVGSGLSIDADGVLSATGAGSTGGYGKIAMTTLKTTERVNGIAGGEDDVAVDATVPCAVGEMDGALSLTSAPAYRALRTTYTAGTMLHLEFEWLLDGVSLDPRMLVAAVLTVGNSSTLVPVTTRTVDDKLYKVVEFKATSDIKAGMFVSLKFF